MSSGPHVGIHDSAVIISHRLTPSPVINLGWTIQSYIRVDTVTHPDHIPVRYMYLRVHAIPRCSMHNHRIGSVTKRLGKDFVYETSIQCDGPNLCIELHQVDNALAWLNCSPLVRWPFELCTIKANITDSYLPDPILRTVCPVS